MPLYHDQQLTIIGFNYVIIMWWIYVHFVLYLSINPVQFNAWPYQLFYNQSIIHCRFSMSPGDLCCLALFNYVTALNVIHQFVFSCCCSIKSGNGWSYFVATRGYFIWSWLKQLRRIRNSSLLVGQWIIESAEWAWAFFSTFHSSCSLSFALVL